MNFLHFNRTGEGKKKRKNTRKKGKPETMGKHREKNIKT
jgi:hypothetical protein